MVIHVRDFLYGVQFVYCFDRVAYSCSVVDGLDEDGCRMLLRSDGGHVRCFRYGFVDVGNVSDAVVCCGGGVWVREFHN